MKRIAGFLMFVFSLGCSPKPERAPSVEPLRVAAASDLQAVMPRLIERFETSAKIRVVATFGASGQLSQQIKQGAPFDVFLSANRSFVSDLAEIHAIDPLTVRDYAIGSLVLVVREDLADKVASLADLERTEVKKIAIANPKTAPYGAAARQALERSGLWDRLESKRVQSENVRQALQFAQTGNVEAAIVGAAIANVPGLVGYPIDPSTYEPIWQALGVTEMSTQPEQAKAFCQFVLAGEGRAILNNAGFRAPSEPDFNPK